MGVLPLNRVELINFCLNHADVWAVAPTTIGLTAGQVTALNTAALAADNAYKTALAARAASKGSTAAYHDAVNLLRGKAAPMVAAIKAFADAQANPGAIYAAAQIPQPAPGVPLPPPGKPEGFSITLQPTGAVTLSWRSTDSAASTGAFFTVVRKLPGESVYTPVGSVNGSTLENRRCTFTDETIPASAASAGASYIVRGARGTRLGEMSDAVLVQFGIDGPTMSMSSSEGIKLAA